VTSLWVVPAHSASQNARKRAYGAGTHTPCPLDRARLHSPSKTGVNTLMSGPCFHRDDVVRASTIAYSAITLYVETFTSTVRCESERNRASRAR
jgi:hypothetical protein